MHARRGWVKILTDRPEEALADFAHALRIGQREPYAGTFHWGMASANLMLNRDADAVAQAVRAVAINPGLPNLHLQLASTLALVGRMEEAGNALDDYRKFRSDMTVEVFRLQSRKASGHPLYLATRDREAEALRAIGMPEE